MARRRKEGFANFVPQEPQCALCLRRVGQVSRHHLVPRKEGGKHGPVADLCQPCHSTVHLLVPNRTLALRYGTIENLREAEELQKYLFWIRRSRVERISNHRKRY